MVFIVVELFRETDTILFNTAAFIEQSFEHYPIESFDEGRKLHHERTEERRKLLQSKQGEEWLELETYLIVGRNYWEVLCRAPGNQKIFGELVCTILRYTHIRPRTILKLLLVSGEGTTRTEHQVAEIENTEVHHYNERAVDVPGADNPPMGEFKPRMTKPPMTIADIIRAKMRAKKEMLDGCNDELVSAENNSTSG
jgi:hypothetical protein